MARHSHHHHHGHPVITPPDNPTGPIPATEPARDADNAAAISNDANAIITGMQALMTTNPELFGGPTAAAEPAAAASAAPPVTLAAADSGALEVAPMAAEIHQDMVHDFHHMWV